MERLSFKKLNQMIEEFNQKHETDLIIFPNMYGYGIARKGGWQLNIFNGKANECAAFIEGLSFDINRLK
jgi:hypothetical protein